MSVQLTVEKLLTQAGHWDKKIMPNVAPLRQVTEIIGFGTKRMEKYKNYEPKAKFR